MPNFRFAVTSVTRVFKNIISNFCGHECEKITKNSGQISLHQDLYVWMKPQVSITQKMMVHGL